VRAGITTAPRLSVRSKDGKKEEEEEKAKTRRKSSGPGNGDRTNGGKKTNVETVRVPFSFAAIARSIRSEG